MYVYSPPYVLHLCSFDSWLGFIVLFFFVKGEYSGTLLSNYKSKSAVCVSVTGNTVLSIPTMYSNMLLLLCWTQSKVAQPSSSCCTSASLMSLSRGIFGNAFAFYCYRYISQN